MRPERSPKVPNAARLERRALAYLGRYPASAARLRRVLWRRAWSEARTHDIAADELDARIQGVVAKLEGLGLVDDAGFAAGRARALLRRGWRVDQVRRSLAGDGVAPHHVDAALAQALPGDVDADAAAAIRFARRRGLGPFRSAAERARFRERDLRSLARRGFDLRLARSIVDAADPLALDDVLA